MSREIKFRAWSNVRKEFIHNEYLLTDSVKGIMKIAGVTFRQQESDLDDDVEIMQYTELKDTNGDEIYEGDIMKRDNYYGGKKMWQEISTVIFKNGQFMLVWKDKVETSLFNLLKGFSVIGNIYENPELLNPPVK